MSDRGLKCREEVEASYFEPLHWQGAYGFERWPIAELGRKKGFLELRCQFLQVTPWAWPRFFLLKPAE